ncbi:MAG TPA: GNAT family N-acetyltransferase [Jatrophihabitans sp.]|nr:GNAT family N-acetyltransferase [Jatrophihabitans sp.]
MTDELQPTLSGRGVLLRPWAASDADVVFKICQDRDIQRWTPVPVPYRHRDAVTYVTEAAPAGYAAGGGVFAICDGASGEVAGTIGAHRLVNGVAHVGYWIAAEARGRGFATDALRTITAWLLRHRGAERVELVAEPDNTASRRVASSAGFTEEGTLRRRWLLHERRIDAVMYSMLPDDAGAAELS